MVKQKTKIGPIDTKCVECPVGMWRFSTGEYEWEWQNRMGLNLHVRNAGDINYEPSLYAKTLDHAVMFAQGFEAGRKGHG